RGPASYLHLALFCVAAAGSFSIMAALNFMIGTCAIPLKSILALIRAKYWLVELLSGLLLPISFFPAPIQKLMAWLPFEHIAYTPLQIYLGKLDVHNALVMILREWIWVFALLWLAEAWWNRAVRKITIQGG
ncbi:MAG: ABC-2 family transporter protein, partial [Candidatus Acidiferrales bacterium]